MATRGTDKGRQGDLREMARRIEWQRTQRLNAWRCTTGAGASKAKSMEPCNRIPNTLWSVRVGTCWRFASMIPVSARIIEHELRHRSAVLVAGWRVVVLAAGSQGNEKASAVRNHAIRRSALDYSYCVVRGDAGLRSDLCNPLRSVGGGTMAH